MQQYRGAAEGFDVGPGERHSERDLSLNFKFCEDVIAADGSNYCLHSDSR